MFQDFCFYLAGVSRYHSYLNSAKTILERYNGEEPLSSFLKKYFAAHKKFGSKDRKQISNLCYCYFRLGKAALPTPPAGGGILEDSLKMEEKILAGLFLCSDKSNEILDALKPEWNVKTGLSKKEKCSIVNAQFSIRNVFPWKEELSEGISHEELFESFFVQPDLFLRIRPGHAEAVLLKLDKTGVEYEFTSPFTVRLPNSFKADEYFELDKEVVVQDYSSQKVHEFLPVRRGPSDRVWDCCAGSGGKSILLNDILGKIDLTVSDVRESILKNLEKRFAKAGIRNYKSFDLTQPVPGFQQDTFNLILADIPCSGSGTWSRTPEQLYYFDAKKIDEYAALQRKIVSNIIDHIEPGGYLLYITCSVFKKENEDLVNFIKEKFHLQTVKIELIKGYDKKADTMFAALLKKPL